MNDNEREMDLALAEAEQENRLLRARNERLERKLAENARELGLDYEPAPVQPAHISPKQLLALAQEANLGLDKVIEVFRMAAPVQPVQEPVALEMDGKQLTLGEALEEAIAATERSASKRLNAVLVAAKNALYTTPPAAQRQWVGLTDEERDAIFELHHTRLGGWDYSGDEVMYDKHFEDAVAAIEAKLRKKNAAAQPAVPDAIHHTDLSEHPQYIEGWNDCRAEMLKGMKP